MLVVNTNRVVAKTLLQIFRKFLEKYWRKVWCFSKMQLESFSLVWIVAKAWSLSRESLIFIDCGRKHFISLIMNILACFSINRITSISFNDHRKRKFWKNNVSICLKDIINDFPQWNKNEMKYCIYGLN